MATSEIVTYESEVKPDWCPGCGDFGVLAGLKRAAGMLHIDPKDILVVSGIGCSSNLPGFFNSYGFHGLHGRAMPVASGAKLANPDLNVVVTGGDGDGYGIGLGHFIHAMRRNLNITYIVMDNGVYGLTTGQVAPTAEKGFKTKSSPDGVIEMPINPIALALVSGATFVSRAFSGDPIHMADVIASGIKHPGFSLVDVFSPCVTYNKINSYEFYRPRMSKLDQAGHDTHSMEAAIKRSYEWGQKIPIGVFYQTERPTYESEDAVLKNGPLVKQKPVARDPEILLREFL